MGWWTSIESLLCVVVHRARWGSDVAMWTGLHISCWTCGRTGTGHTAGSVETGSLCRREGGRRGAGTAHGPHVRVSRSRWGAIARQWLRLVWPVGAGGRTRTRRRSDRRESLLLWVEGLVGRLVALLGWAVRLVRSSLGLRLGGLCVPLVARLAGLAVLLRVLVTLSIVCLRLLWARVGGRLVRLSGWAEWRCSGCLTGIRRGDVSGMLSGRSCRVTIVGIRVGRRWRSAGSRPWRSGIACLALSLYLSEAI